MKKLKEVEKLLHYQFLKECIKISFLSKEEYYKCIDEFKKIVEKREFKNE